ncbi:MAG: molybdopterin molybdotransferase MoeA [Acidobacteria bacterium]|nr:molybdopterin molybdotransferase MoeA [Acidobacteriota bacterium]
MSTVTFTDARACVLREVRAASGEPPTEIAALADAADRVLAEDVAADRDYPPLDRSMRDGFAVASAGPVTGVRVIGEVRAGTIFEGAVGPGEAVEIMTGAPAPAGADAVVMVEHVQRDGDRIAFPAPSAGQNISPRAAEARRGDVVVPRGRRLDYASIAMAATVGRADLRVYRRPSVAILATGDEIVEAGQQPRDFEIRNSNAWSLAAQVTRAGGRPHLLPVARDRYDHTRELIERGLAADLLLLSGGVSAGKYDIVETVLADLGAEFHFDRVRIQPGQPLVFGRARGTFFFGLPGNPTSTMVTFEVLARAAVELLAGMTEPTLAIARARLTAPFRQKPGLTRFLPATLGPGGVLTPLRTSGSSDVVTLARANAYLVSEPDRESWEAGDEIGVLLK